MKTIIEQSKCCGCGACAAVCPRNCVNIIQDENGFWKASCKVSECVQCGLCYSVCPMNNVSAKNNHRGECYAAVSMDKEVYSRCSSGGVFPLLAQKVILDNGYVWGCGYSNDLMPIHKGINSIESLDDLCRSKYVQSYIGNSYAQIKSQLQEGYNVLFCGTPCQVAGLKNYLKIEYENLFLVDLVCHGVPSAGLFKKHIQYLENKYKKKLSRYEFRLKGKENNSYYYNYFFSDGSNKSASYYKDMYFNAFYENISLNDVCYECSYACENRTGDITIGDYEWGKSFHANFEQLDEISCIIVNNDKGKQLLSWLKEDMMMELTEWEWITERNKNLLRPTPRPIASVNFYKNINVYGYKKCVNNYYMSIEFIKKITFMRRAKGFIKKLLKRKTKL